jgi:hypothetical protein
VLNAELPGAKRRFPARVNLKGMVQANHVTVPGAADRTQQAPITSRFLFVDVAAQRAKQLRRGAVPRLEGTSGPHKGLESAAVRAEYQDRTHT